MAFLYVPLVLVVVNSFNRSRTFSFPPSGFTLKWWHAAANSDGALHALGTSVRAGLGATAIALILGTMAAFAVQRFDFFGRSTISFVVILPIALPGIVTGIALNAALSEVIGPTNFGLLTVIIGHATFCIVVVFNNVLARLRRVSRSLEEASSDLGASGWQTFRFVTFPTIRTALVAGALLAFALSFDEIAVTFFLAGADTTTLPLWVLGALRQTQSLPEVNAVAAVILLISLPLIAISAYLMRDEGAASRVVQGE
jgi:putative spermidine/putrescine transport system permease protein